MADGFVAARKMQEPDRECGIICWPSRPSCGVRCRGDVREARLCDPLCGCVERGVARAAVRAVSNPKLCRCDSGHRLSAAVSGIAKHQAAECGAPPRCCVDIHSGSDCHCDGQTGRDGCAGPTLCYVYGGHVQPTFRKIDRRTTTYCDDRLVGRILVSSCSKHH